MSNRSNRRNQAGPTDPESKSDADSFESIQQTLQQHSEVAKALADRQNQLETGLNQLQARVESGFARTETQFSELKSMFQALMSGLQLQQSPNGTATQSHQSVSADNAAQSDITTPKRVLNSTIPTVQSQTPSSNLSSSSFTNDINPVASTVNSSWISAFQY